MVDGGRGDEHQLLDRELGQRRRVRLTEPNALIDYWLAAHLGRIWLRIHPGLRSRIGHLPCRCAAVARGEQLPAAELWEAQDFAVRLWWRCCMVLLALIGVGGGITAAVCPDSAGAGIAVDLMIPLAYGMAVTMGQSIMTRYRSDRIRLYLRRAGARAGAQPLPAGSPGLPRRSDFWVITAIAVAAGTILFAGVWRALARQTASETSGLMPWSMSTGGPPGGAVPA